MVKTIPTAGFTPPSTQSSLAKGERKLREGISKPGFPVILNEVNGLNSLKNTILRVAPNDQDLWREAGKWLWSRLKADG